MRKSIKSKRKWLTDDIFYLANQIVQHRKLIKQRECGTLNKNAPLRLIHLNTWAPVGGNISEELGSVDLFEEMYHWGWALGFQKPMPFQLVFSESCLQIWI